MTWFSSLSRWLSGTPPTRSASRSFDPESFIALCQEDPEEARSMLAADQSLLAQEIESTFEAYDERLAQLAGRVHRLTPDEFAREAKTIREAQDGLRRALRRLEVSAKTAKELQQELAEWDDRDDDSPLHADHPAFRSEIIGSELRSRGVDVRTRSMRSPTEMSSPRVTDSTGMPEGGMTTPGPDDEDVFSIGKNSMLWFTHDADTMGRRQPQFARTADDIPEPLTMPEVEHLLTAIREATREAERWHAIPEDEHGEDALLQVHHVRELHALLKRLDREQGVRRDRIDLSIWPSDLH